jgi:hypothetical protein
VMTKLKHKELTYEFVESAPDNLRAGVLYISTKYASAIHKCCCGCGNEVVTPLSPVEWSLTFDGETVSLEPSIGNWDFPCRSHYWITRNKVTTSYPWSQKRIDTSRAKDQAALKKHLEVIASKEVKE